MSFKNDLSVKILSAAVLLLSICIIFLVYQSSQNSSLTYQNEIASREEVKYALLRAAPSDFTVGVTNPVIEIVVYIDTDCVFCEKFATALDSLLAEYPNTLAITYRSYKLQEYPNSIYEHKALECVGQIAGADQYHLFQNNTLLKNKLTGPQENHSAQVTVWAEEYLGSGQSENFLECFNSKVTQERLRSKTHTGYALGVSQVPSWFIIKDKRVYQYLGYRSLNQLRDILGQFDI